MTKLGLVLVLAAAACGAPPIPPPTLPAPAHPTAATPTAGTEDATDPRRALADLDETSKDSVEAAVAACKAIGAAKRLDAIAALARVIAVPTSKEVFPAQIAAIEAVGQLDNGAAAAAPALDGALDKKPKTERDLVVIGAAANAAGALHQPHSAERLVLAMYRAPQVFNQVRRALIAIGPAAELVVRDALAGRNAEVTQLFDHEKLDRWCDKVAPQPVPVPPNAGAVKPEPPHCEWTSAKDFYASAVLGDFNDPATVPELLAVLKQTPLPTFYANGKPALDTQFNAVFDALLRIGSPTAAGPVRDIWQQGTDLGQRVLAIDAYPFVARDDVGLIELGVTMADNNVEDSVRQAAAGAFALLAHDANSISELNLLAKRFYDASAAAATKLPKLKGPVAAADRELERAQKQHAVAVSSHTAATPPTPATADQIKRADAAFAAAVAVHKKKTRDFRQLTAAVDAYHLYGRTFQTHIARIEVAVRCEHKLECYAATLRATPEDAAAAVSQYIPDAGSWSDDDKRALLTASIERAMLEIGKRGHDAQDLTGVVLDGAASEVPLVRQSVLYALPKIAKLPCELCVKKLDAAIAAGTGKPALADLELTTTLVRNYFTWAGRASN